ncbi:hypothetical protein [Streptomyces sp. NPDC088725]|uniref:hypothetical protein n=1 Tax=Streptomyces sp. NPDC088725 TaxID=3365873 RepID=UPI0037F1A689
MSAVSPPHKSALIGAATLGTLLLVSGSAFASNGVQDGVRNGQKASADLKGQNLSAMVESGGVSYNTAKNGKGASAGPLVPQGTWTPPPCWYAPMYSPAEFQKMQEAIWNVDSTGPEFDAAQRDRYVNGKPYTDFNKDKAGKGYWWSSHANESFPPGWDGCTKQDFWVDKGDPPPNYPQIIKPETLAGLAYEKVVVPTTKVSLSPAANTKVNLPTWAWLDKGEFHPVSVTASVPALGISATTTATPVSVKLEPGTPDATTYPASGVCEFGADGSIGAKYTPGHADKNPPCGITYLRSSGDGTFNLRATITWKISWTSNVAAGGDLPDGNFGSDQPITVQEIQSVNR